MGGPTIRHGSGRAPGRCAALVIALLSSAAGSQEALPGLPPFPLRRDGPPERASGGEVVLGFDNREDTRAATLVTRGWPIPAGPAGGAALQLPDSGAVSIHRAPRGDTSSGRLTLWFRAPGVTAATRTLFHLGGRRSLDGDGHLDLFVGGASPDAGPAWSHLYFGAPGGPSRQDPLLLRTRAPRGLAVGDVDGDGVDDLLVADNGADAIHVHRGPLCPGDVRAFPSDPALVLPVVRPQGLALADLEGDGDLDVVACSYSEHTQPIALFENDGAGRFTAVTLEPAGWLAPGEGLAVADLDHDGLLDLAYGALDTGVPSGVLLGSLDEQGRYRPAIDDPERRFPLSDQVLGVDIADVDGDGWEDVVLARVHHDRIVVHRNRAGRFAAEPDLELPVLAPFTVCADRDVDQDGFLDIAAASFRSGPTRGSHSVVLLGPDFERQLLFPVTDAVALTVGDLDGDGLHDLFVRSATAPRSPGFLLGPGGEVRERFELRTVPSHPGPFGAGVGVFAASTGSSPYTTILERGAELAVELVGERLVWRLRDGRGRKLEASLPWDPDRVDVGRGLHDYQALEVRWSGPDGRLDLWLGDPDAGPRRHARAEAGAALEIGPLEPVFRLGSGAENQRPCPAAAFDGVRLAYGAPGDRPD